MLLVVFDKVFLINYANSFTALIPLALKGNEAGNEIQSPMAIVILGGLFSSTLLNLIVIPCVYRLVNSKNERLP